MLINCIDVYIKLGYIYTMFPHYTMVIAYFLMYMCNYDDVKPEVNIFHVKLGSMLIYTCTCNTY